jgi:hypothetical protein
VEAVGPVATIQMASVPSTKCVLRRLTSPQRHLAHRFHVLAVVAAIHAMTTPLVSVQSTSSVQVEVLHSTKEQQPLVNQSYVRAVAVVGPVQMAQQVNVRQTRTARQGAPLSTRVPLQHAHRSSARAQKARTGHVLTTQTVPVHRTSTVPLEQLTRVRRANALMWHVHAVELVGPAQTTRMVSAQ